MMKLGDVITEYFNKETVVLRGVQAGKNHGMVSMLKKFPGMSVVVQSDKVKRELLEVGVNESQVIVNESKCNLLACPVVV